MGKSGHSHQLSASPGKRSLDTKPDILSIEELLCHPPPNQCVHHFGR